MGAHMDVCVHGVDIGLGLAWAQRVWKCVW